MATFSPTYNPDQHGPQGFFERGFEDYDQLEESCEFPIWTLAGIKERAQATTCCALDYAIEHKRLVEEAIDFLMAEIAKYQAIQKSTRHDSTAWSAASAKLAPLLAEMAKFRAAGFDTNVQAAPIQPSAETLRYVGD